MGQDVNPVVVIPVHRPELAPLENISMAQNLKTFIRRRVILLVPQSMNIEYYSRFNSRLEFYRVKDDWMASIRSYNSMITAAEICKIFRSHSHVLICEPDAMVIFDRLEFWCSRAIDYIGAPWFAANDTGGVVPHAVGNSGLSLMRVNAALSALQSGGRWYSYSMIVRDIAAGIVKRDLKRLRRALKGLGKAGKLGGAWQIYNRNCDVFWSFTVPAHYDNFRVASVEDALSFSWETYPRQCYDLAAGELPMGFHAWARYDMEFILSILAGKDVDLVPELRAVLIQNSGSYS